MPFLGFEPSWPSPLARCGWVTTCLRHSCAPPARAVVHRGMVCAVRIRELGLPWGGLGSAVWPLLVVHVHRICAGPGRCARAVLRVAESSGDLQSLLRYIH